MTKTAASRLTKQARLSLNEFAGLCTGRIARVHFQRAAIEKHGNRLLMTGPSGEHGIDIAASDLDRTNAHWTAFATSPANLWA